MFAFYCMFPLWPIVMKTIVIKLWCGCMYTFFKHSNSYLATWGSIILVVLIQCKRPSILDDCIFYAIHGLCLQDNLTKPMSSFCNPFTYLTYIFQKFNIIKMWGISYCFASVTIFDETHILHHCESNSFTASLMKLIQFPYPLWPSVHYCKLASSTT